MTRIASKIQKLSETDKELKDYIQSMSAMYNWTLDEKWKNFDEKYLKPTIAIETHDLVSNNKKESEDSEDNLYPDDVE